MEQHNLKPEDIYTVYLTASLSGKAEAAYDISDGDVDLVLTPLEVRRMFIRRGADLKLLKPQDFDLPVEHLEIPVYFPDHRDIAIWKVNGEQHQFKVADAQSLRLANKLLDEAKLRKSSYALIYLSACRGEKANLGEMLSCFGSISIED